MGAKALLSNARLLIEQGWSQHADARTAAGTQVAPWDEAAACWSLLGALVASVEQTATSDGETVAISELALACTSLAAIVDSDSLERWNDAPERTRDDVLDALAQAAAHRPDDPGYSITLN